jgi:hypothetical protein
MIVQEDVPYTKEEVKAMVRTIHDLREKLSLLGWRPASERPKVGEDGDVEVIVIQDNYNVDKAIYCEIEGIGMWDLPNIKWWCYPPKEE